MQKINLTPSFMIDNTLIDNTGKSLVFRTKTGEIIKLFTDDLLKLFEAAGFDIEDKILSADRIINKSGLLLPNAACYFLGRFCGYKMPPARGVSYNKYDEGFSHERREDLLAYAKDYQKIEKIVKDHGNMVFPDLCSRDNIFVDSNGRITFIDYDGTQVGNCPTFVVSSLLGKQSDLLASPKYYRGNNLFTKELDKKSLMHLYFITAFNVDLSMIGNYVPELRRKIVLDDIFECLNLDDADVCHKVWKVFHEKEGNDYLGDDVFRLAEKYDLICYDKIEKGYLKKLGRKK